ncbi:MAG: hypothetical protein H7243_12225, partial [Sphingomonadaceae bacterium]|nr:hypothetical protein [Sphingomonadaceae bacterium]
LHQHDEPIVELPPFATVAEMIAHDERFAAAHATQTQDFRELDALRTLNKYDTSVRSTPTFGQDLDEHYAYDYRIADPKLYYKIPTTTADQATENSGYAHEDKEYVVTQRLINFSAAQTDVILSDVQWAAWKEWGITLAAIDKFTNIRVDHIAPWKCHQNLVWLYLLKGRLCKSDAALPPQFRELLFDWLELPVTFAEEACTRYLVPVHALDGELGDDDETNIQRRAWARDKRIC